MKQKMTIIIISFVILAIGCIAYFYPLSLSKGISEDSRFVVIITKLGTRSGEAINDSTVYDSITDTQRSDIRSLIENYSCRRTLTTYFSDTTIEDSEALVSIYVYSDEALERSILVSDTGKMILDDKVYKMKNTEQFVERIVDILES